jgi:hypothetical protein
MCNYQSFNPFRVGAYTYVFPVILTEALRATVQMFRLYVKYSVLNDMVKGLSGKMSSFLVKELFHIRLTPKR